MFAAMANQVVRIRQKPFFHEFYHRRTKQNISILWRAIVPLLREDASTAFFDFCAIMAEAHSLALEMFCGPHEFKFDYPEVNDNFDVQWMINRDPSMIGDPQTLMKNKVRV